MTKFKVTFMDAPGVEEIEADYFKIDQGVLTFRKNRVAPGEYPEAVVVMAPGAWRTVERVS